MRCRYPGHPESVDALVAFDNDTVLTGSADGCVRIVSILPNQLLGVLGSHGEDEAIEAMALSANRRTLVTLAHDRCVQLWSLAALHDDSDDDEGGDTADVDAAGAVDAGTQAAGTGELPSCFACVSCRLPQCTRVISGRTGLIAPVRMPARLVSGVPVPYRACTCGVYLNAILAL